MNNDNINKKSDSFNFTDVVKKINSDSEGTPWYKKKVSIISMSSVLGVGALATVIAVPIALTSGNTTSNNDANKDWKVSSIKSIYDLNEKYAKLFIIGKNLPKNVSSYKVFSSTITNTRGPITSNIKLTPIMEKDANGVDVQVGFQLGFNDSTLVSTTKYQVVINGDSTPINTEQHILQPIINIGTQPTSQTIASDTASKKVTLTVVATVQNQIVGQELKYQWYLSDTNDQNNNSSWVPIEGATSASYEYDAANIPASTKKYFRCVVSYVYTEAKTSSSVYVEKAAGTPPPPVVTPEKAIETFNNKTKDEKLTAYNTIMANATNNTAIKNHFIKNAGMSKFFNENVQPITSGAPKETYDEFKAFLPSYKNSATVTYKPEDGTNFLRIKAIGIVDSNGKTINTDASTDDTNIYCQQAQNLSANIGRYVFYSPILSTVTNVTMNSDFSITMSLSTDNKVTNTAFQVISSKSFAQYYISYKTTIKFSNETLFPSMSDFVKKSILNLTV